MVYALREALRVVVEEGLDARIERHRRTSKAFWAGVEALGLGLYVTEPDRAVPLTTVVVPDGVVAVAVQQQLLSEYNIEIGGGLGPLKGKVWRVGLMGHSSSEENVDRFLEALKSLL